MIDEGVVKDLCHLGKLGESASPDARAVLERLRPRGRLSCLYWSAWKDVADTLDRATLANLVRGLLLTEEALREWRAGSVSPVIWTFHFLRQRSFDDADRVAKWGEDKTTNFYVPFSPQRAAYWKEKAERAERVRAIEEQQRIDAMWRRHERSLLGDTHRTVSLRKKKERLDFLERMATLPLPDRLRAVLENRHRPLSWFPDSWAAETLATVGELDPELRLELIERLAGQRKGRWHELREALDRRSR
jgi:hypothetical protein